MGDCWVGSEDPVLRAVAATMMEPFSGTVLRDEFRRLLDDADGYVRESAVKRVALAFLPGAKAIMSEAANRPRPGWMCLSCRTVNPPSGSSSCRKEGCIRVGAGPAKVAAELLNRPAARFLNPTRRNPFVGPTKGRLNSPARFRT
jgi:hypothetical protein